MFAKQKAQEISLALIKISIYVRREDLRHRLERLAFELLEETARRNFEKVLAVIDVLEEMIKFGRTVYEIEPINAKILLQELDSLDLAIKQSVGLNGHSNGEVEQIFSKVPAVIAKTEDAAELLSGNGNPNGNSNGNGNTAMRQSAIVEKIRQYGNAAMKDLMLEFSDVSERTLRYDLQKLCNQGVIERIGNGGPYSYYTVSNKADIGSL